MILLGEMEFFRVVPNESPDRRIFPVHGLTVDVNIFPVCLYFEINLKLKTVKLEPQKKLQ